MSSHGLAPKTLSHMTLALYTPMSLAFLSSAHQTVEFSLPTAWESSEMLRKQSHCWGWEGREGHLLDLAGEGEPSKRKDLSPQERDRTQRGGLHCSLGLTRLVLRSWTVGSISLFRSVEKMTDAGIWSSTCFQGDPEPSTMVGKEPI